MAVSPIKTSLRLLSCPDSQQDTLQPSATPSAKKFAVNLIQEVINGILVFSEQQQLIYISNSAHKIFSRLQPDSPSTSQVPAEIWHICQSIIQSRHRFPRQSWLTEFDILTQNATVLHIHSQWLKLEQQDTPYLVLMIEDRQQAIHNILLEEADQYNLTPREKEVWLLHRSDLTYKQIAVELGITPNTVKKHMKSIHAKQKQSAYCQCTQD